MLKSDRVARSYPKRRSMSTTTSRTGGQITKKKKRKGKERERERERGMKGKKKKGEIKISCTHTVSQAVDDMTMIYSLVHAASMTGMNFRLND